MFPQEGPALFGVAGVASLVGRGFYQHLRPGGTMRVVAFCAGGLANQNGMHGEKMDFRTLSLVAIEAYVGLFDLIQHFVLGCMGGVAIAASHALHFMLATAPMGAQTAFMAAYAFTILGCGMGRLIGFGFCAKNDVRGRPTFLAGIAFQMGITLTVTLLA